MQPDRLSRYRAKRDPQRTPEPFGERPARAATQTRNGGLFVVQQHAARRMHWDLRLDIEGVLVSWAVPRGPSMDPKDRRLAVQTEDHPIEYADFEGIIPAGNYGAGAMLVWDRGTYCTIDQTGALQGLRNGKIDVQFRGQKLRGRWTLVRTKGGAAQDWLLLHKAEPGTAAVVDLVVQQPWSVYSGLTIDEVAAGIDRTAALRDVALQSGGKLRSPDATLLRPMLAQPGPLPTNAGWHFELKYDGMRVIAAADTAREVRLVGRSGRDATGLFPELTAALRHLPCSDFAIDGEVVALDERGAPSFELLQPRMQARDMASVERAAAMTPVVLYAFDLLRIAGCDVRHLPLSARKQLLQQLLPALGLVRNADVFDDGQALYETASRLELEGVVAKRADSRYRSGERSADWRKIKAYRTADLAIVGFLYGRGSRRRLGALMLAWQDGAALRYAGNVGTGFTDASLSLLTDRLQGLRQGGPAFSAVPALRKRDMVFVQPQLVAEVRYGEVTSAGVLRHPVFLGLRTDKGIDQCDSLPAKLGSPALLAEAPRELPEDEPVDFRPTKVDKLFWPDDGYTKGDLLAYYDAVWPWLQPYLRDRPVVLTRYPDGIVGKSFFQKNAPPFTPPWVITHHVDDTDFFICNDLDTLRYVINSGCIPLHVWSARRQNLNLPDWLIIDLDPKGAPFRDVIAIARRLHQVLEKIAVPHFAKTSGQDGLHILVPSNGQLTHEQVRTLAELLARLLVNELPQIATVTRTVEARGGKVYVDFLQNGYGKLIVAPFSVRPRPRAPVSTPIPWSQVTSRLDPTALTMRTVPERMRKMGDPMLPLLSSTWDVGAALSALGDLMSAE